MTYDFSVFSRGNYYKDSLYFKNTKGFRLYLLLIFRYIAKKTFHAASKGTTRPADSLIRSQIKAPAGGGLPPRTVKSPGYLRPDKKTAPETGTGEVSRLVGGLHRQGS